MNNGIIVIMDGAGGKQPIQIFKPEFGSNSFISIVFSQIFSRNLRNTQEHAFLKSSPKWTNK